MKLSYVTKYLQRFRYFQIRIHLQLKFEIECEQQIKKYSNCCRLIKRDIAVLRQGVT